MAGGGGGGGSFYFVLKKKKKQHHVGTSFKNSTMFGTYFLLVYKNSTKVFVFSVFLCLLKKCAHTPNYYTNMFLFKDG